MSLLSSLLSPIYTPKSNLTATTNPSVNDDISLGYQTGSQWFNQSTAELFVCISNALGAAVWEQTTLDIGDLGSMAVQDANNVEITGGTIDGTIIGGTATAAGSFETVIAGASSTRNLQLVGDATYPTLKSISSTDSNVPLTLMPKGTGAIQAAQPDSTAVGGNARASYSTDLQRSRTIATQVASGLGSVIAGGSGNTSSNNYSTVSGGEVNQALGTYTTVGGGTQNQASSSYSTIGGGGNNTTNAIASTIPGGFYGNARSIIGNFVMPACSSPIASASGVSQATLLVLGKITTDSTPAILASNSSAAATSNQLTLPNNSAYYVRGSIVAGVTGAGNSKSWVFDCLIKRGATAATVAFVGTPVLTSPYADAGAAGWAIAVQTDTTLGCLKITATGNPATTIRWVAKLEAIEMTY